MGVGSEDYKKALKAGKKEYQSRLMKGERPTLGALDDILPSSQIQTLEPLGLVQIPLDQIAGTRYGGRTTSFAPNFMPLLDERSEFATKWGNLSYAHSEEGIRDPIKAVEYMNKFYVEEGNKRVSVMKYFEAVSILGNVTRIIPKRTDEKENKIYFEYIDFYKYVPITFLWFSEEGCYARITEAVGKQPEEKWTEDEIIDFTSVFNRFSMAYEAHGGKQLSITTGDAFLAFLELYGYASLQDITSSELTKLVDSSWKEFVVLQQSGNVELKMDPESEPKKPVPLLNLIMPTGKTHLKIAFIYEKTPSASSWTYAHELGRLHLEEAFPDEVETVRYENASADNIERFLELAIHEKCNIIFTTSPTFVQASVKAAIENPQVKILNCSLKTAHSYIRTYYCRMHEAKFLMGAIAGAMADNDRISYIADYPLFGTISHINAFALGAKMVNPRAKIYLEWSTLKNNDIWENISRTDPSCISGKDMMIPDEANRYFGLYHVKDGQHRRLAMPLCNWGKIYEKLIRTIMDGSWKAGDESTKAINYWWGMSSGMVDVICSQNLPIGIKRLVELLTNTISSGEFQLFSGVLYSQEGIVHDSDDALSAEEVMDMDWLAENVVGRIPEISELTETAKPVISQQGLPGKKG